MVPRAVLMKSGLVSLNTARQVNTAHPKITINSARPMTNLSKSAHSTVKWPIHKNTTFKNSNFNQRVNTVKYKKFNTARPKTIVNALKGNNVNVVKALACWGNPQMDLQDQGVIDSGCSRHMTGNMSYLKDYEEIDRGSVAFRGNPKGGKITGRDPRKNNMYSVDLKNIVPKGGLTCLFAKATSNESELWHRRLGHINLKTMNKLVKGNLVRGLPSKRFETNQTCVACQKGKQHRASCNSKTVKNVNVEVQLQALVNGKKIIVTEASVRRDLQLNDEEGTDCLPNATILKNLQGWATNKKFNFSKYIFESKVKNLENVSNHKRNYFTPSHTKKIFGNMRRVGKGFSGRETPLFPTMMVQAQEEIDEAVYEEMDDSLERAAT
ncbi:putative ribonuclease H-like domain-containing protein [Tanacetum coccineum]